MIRIHRVHWRAGGSGLKSLGKYLGKQGPARLSYRLIIIYSYAHIFAFLRLRNAFLCIQNTFYVGQSSKLLAHKGEGQSGKYLEMEKYLAPEKKTSAEKRKSEFFFGRKEGKLGIENVLRRHPYKSNIYSLLHNAHTHFGRPFGSFSRFASEKLCLVCTSSNMNS